MINTTFPVIEPFHPEKIREIVESRNKSKIFRLDIFDSIGSTNQYLLEQARTKCVSGWICFAEQQTQGRGRLGRTWFSPRGGNIYCSVLWRFPAAVCNLSGLSLAVGVMVEEVLHKYGVHSGVGLKWPNDIHFENRKLGGILIESVVVEKDFLAVVIGIGINLQLSGMENNWIDLMEITGEPVRRNFFAGLLVNELVEKLEVFEEVGFAGFMSGWNRVDCLVGKRVRVFNGDICGEGVVRGVNELGELILRGDDGVLLSYRCGEVSVRGI